jgi:chromosome transmission fidelity protein 1
MDFILLDGDDEELGNDDSLSSARRSHSGFRVLYCSRTHSQLSQFIGEVRRTPFVEQKPPVATTVLASRKQMCIHPEVRRLRSATAVNDRCHELRTKKVTLPSGVQQVACPFYDEERIHHLTEVMHDRVCDLEDLMELGQRHRACPYYAARASFQAAELVLMPYQTLLHETTRKSAKVGIDERTIVIIDEAHNLVDALNDMYSVRVSLCEIRAMQTSLESFICNQKRWKPDPQRSYCLEQLRRLLDALEGAIDPPPRKMNNVVATTRSQGIVIDPVANAFGRTQGMESDSTDPDDGASHELCQSPSDFVFQLEIENMNFAAILTYLFQSRCIYMLQSAHESQRREGEWMQAPNDASSAAGLEANIADRAMLQSSAGSFFDLVALLKVLSEPGAEGRVLTAPKRHVRYLLLDPATYFSPIYRQARATILAGGTLEPREALLPRLFDQAHCKKLSFRSFPHVVPPEHTLALFVGQGPRSIAFDFSYAHRHGVEQINELGRLLLNVCAVVPAGLVVFFPSYAFEDSVWKHFHESGVAASLGKRKKVFRERRHGDTEALLEDFRQAVQGTSTAASAGPAGPRGALLSAVIGGRLSEGINFADDLGRCVVVVGLPFPNAWQTETRLQVQFLRERQRQLSQHSDSGGEFIENVCMIAVNQTVGRVIRHAGDYAAILFVDQRYEQQPRLRRKLSCWLRDRVQIPPSFGHAFQLLAQFFRERRSRSP